MISRLLAMVLAPAALALGIVRSSSADEPARGKAAPADGVLKFQVKDIDGKPVALDKYKGEVLLIVNTASQCGYTPQYRGLEAVYDKYKAKGFAVLAFPANEFGRQEPGSNAEIKAFCSTNYEVSFPLFSKIVVKGEGIDPLYAYLTGKDTNPKFAGEIPWNFAKFLVNRKGEVVARFGPGDAPESETVVKAIEAALGEGK